MTHISGRCRANNRPSFETGCPTTNLSLLNFYLLFSNILVNHLTKVNCCLESCSVSQLLRCLSSSRFIWNLPSVCFVPSFCLLAYRYPYKAQDLSRSLVLFHFLQLSSRKKTTSYKLSSTSSKQREQITNHHGLHPDTNPTSHLPLHKHTPLPTIHNATRRQKTSRHRRQASHKRRPPLNGLPQKGPSGQTPERCR